MNIIGKRFRKKYIPTIKAIPCPKCGGGSNVFLGLSGRSVYVKCMVCGTRSEEVEMRTDDNSEIIPREVYMHARNSCIVNWNNRRNIQRRSS